ncbi:hypothetical protein GCM10022244_13740 [Streptomyces gulbargensis]|uniref:Uncharacterized protein n=1 Tax=Streptomyces gulbargensis TaxID=364901 RepID=A0ABP7LS55_9ACTN
MAATALRGRPWDAYAASPFRINMRPSCHGWAAARAVLMEQDHLAEEFKSGSAVEPAVIDCVDPGGKGGAVSISPKLAMWARTIW